MKIICTKCGKQKEIVDCNKIIYEIKCGECGTVIIEGRSNDDTERRGT